MLKLFAAVAATGLIVAAAPVSVVAASSRSSDDDTSSSTSKVQDDDNNKDDDDDSKDNVKKSSKKSATTTASSTTEHKTGNASKPGDIIDLKQWYLTLPSGEKGKPDTIKTAELLNYSSDYMHLNDQGDGVVFTANAGGMTTKNSKYPRSELREMDGGKLASWDGNKGTHTMETKQAITKVPPKKSDVVVDQIHATSDDLMQIELEKGKLIAKYDDGKKRVPLDDYKLGDVFTVKIESSKDGVKVWYNGEEKVTLPISSKTSYFKVGNYLQTNTSKGEDADATADVVLYDVNVTHQ